MKKMLIFTIFVVLLLLLVACDTGEDYIPSNEYYQELLDGCGKDELTNGCCVSSVKDMDKGGYELIPGKSYSEHECPEGQSPNTLRCSGSYSWCMDDHNVGNECSGLDEVECQENENCGVKFGNSCPGCNDIGFKDCVLLEKTEQSLCESKGGEWKEFSGPCWIDNYENALIDLTGKEPIRNCIERELFSCDCGPDKYWGEIRVKCDPSDSKCVGGSQYECIPNPGTK